MLLSPAERISFPSGENATVLPTLSAGNELRTLGGLPESDICQSLIEVSSAERTFLPSGENATAWLSDVESVPNDLISLPLVTSQSLVKLPKSAERAYWPSGKTSLT